jgi:hypothetical protein
MVADEDLKLELERLRAENAALKSAGQRNLSFKVSEKGAVSVYGMGRFPVTLYIEQWNALLDSADALRAFMHEHESELKRLERRSAAR